MTQNVLLSLEEQVQPKHAALIVVDPQKDFCAIDGATAAVMGSDVSQIQAAVERLNPFIERAREAGLEVFWTRSGHSIEKTSPVHRYRRSPTGDIIIAKEGTDGADWYKEMIKPLPNEHIITKRHYDAFEATELDHLLRINDIRTLIFTGFTTNVCVETTARHGYAKGYYIILVSDCTGAPTEKEQESALYNINKYFGSVVLSYELTKIWGNQ
jgi:ureidoacrylate peracid hydrolase